MTPGILRELKREMRRTSRTSRPKRNVPDKELRFPKRRRTKSKSVSFKSSKKRNKDLIIQDPGNVLDGEEEEDKEEEVKTEVPLSDKQAVHAYSKLIKEIYFVIKIAFSVGIIFKTSGAIRDLLDAWIHKTFIVDANDCTQCFRFARTSVLFFLCLLIIMAMIGHVTDAVVAWA